MIPGWPSCAKSDCPWPALFKVRMEGGDTGPIVAHLCVFCIIEIRSCLKALSQASEEDRKILQQSMPTAFEKAEITKLEGPENAA